MKTAVVYYSMGGNVRYAAEKIAERSGADLIRIEPVRAYPSEGFRKFFWGGKSAVMGEKPELEPYGFRAGDYEAVVVCTPVWAGRVSPPILSFLTKEKEALQGKKIFAFVSHAGGGAEKALEQMNRLLAPAALGSSLDLVNPKTDPKPDDDRKIESFCEAFAD